MSNTSYGTCAGCREPSRRSLRRLDSLGRFWCESCWESEATTAGVDRGPLLVGSAHTFDHINGVCIYCGVPMYRAEATRLGCAYHLTGLLRFEQEHYSREQEAHGRTAARLTADLEGERAANDRRMEALAADRGGEPEGWTAHAAAGALILAWFSGALTILILASVVGWGS